MGPDLTSGVTEVSLRKGSLGWALKKELRGSRGRGSGAGTQGEQVPGRGNRMSKGSLRGRKPSEFKEPNKGQWGCSPESKVQKGAGAGSCTYRTSTWLTILLALWIVWEPQKEAPMAEPDTGLWGPSVLSFSF